jgi:uncharacterized protein
MAQAQAEKDGATAEGERDPSIEEILASIHQIIAEGEDDKGGGESGGEAAAAPPPPPPEARAEPAPEEEEVLELTERLPDPAPPPPAPKEAVKAPEAAAAPLPPPAPRAEPEAAPEAAPEPAEALIAPATQAAAASALEKLSSHMAIARAPGRTLEDVTREMLAPMLRAWLDAHLPGLIERLVADEIARITRKSGS